ncbi:hypothetical protein RF11_14214 [Thelohanellus kitauei]|uniref:Uncharacterized protein n=1 Tax=Thelohanellus kitauei TaxID=669202 RepID=A0A0C2JAY9_THEKT|nr:hypothetical protein RF11_14214 [Thelohanellus kitauei]
MIVITESGSKRAGHGDDYIHPHILGESLSNNNIRVLFLIQPSKLEHYKILSESFKQQVVGIVDYSSITAVSLNTTIHRADRQGRMIKFNLDHLKRSPPSETSVSDILECREVGVDQIVKLHVTINFSYIAYAGKAIVKKRGLLHRNIILRESDEKCNSHGKLMCGKCDCDSGWYIDSNSGKGIHARDKRGKYLIILSESFKQQVVGIVDYSSITAVSLNTTIHRADRQGRMIKFNLDHLKSKFDTKTYITWYVLKSRKSAKKRGLIHRNIILKESEEKCNSHGQLICGKCDCDSGWYIDSNSGKEIHASVKRGKYLIVTKKWNVKSTTIVGSMASVYEANTPEQFNGPGCVCSDLNCPNTQNGLCICYYIYFATLKVLANAENVFATSAFREMIDDRSQNYCFVQILVPKVKCSDVDRCMSDVFASHEFTACKTPIKVVEKLEEPTSKFLLINDFFTQICQTFYQECMRQFMIHLNDRGLDVDRISLKKLNEDEGFKNDVSDCAQGYKFKRFYIFLLVITSAATIAFFTLGYGLYLFYV